MNPGEAMKIIREEADKYARNAEENFRLIEALEYMIHTTNEVRYMSHLSWIYCCMKRFDLREKYLEMAAMHGDAVAYCDLGYMYYYGQAGVQDYEKAYNYFREGAIRTKYEKNSTWLHCIYILGAVKMATIWLIPKAAEKPADRRRKKGKNNQ